MHMPSGEFRFPPISSVVFGKGSVQRVREKIDEFGAKRALVVTVPPLVAQTDLVERVKRALGDKCAGVFSGVVQHVPRQCVIEGTKMAKEVGADILVSLGGSSPADAAKGINLVLAEAERIDDFFTSFESQEVIKATLFKKPKLCQIAIPTTLSAGEFTEIAGITDPQRKCKDIFRDIKFAPKVIILDPEVTTFTSKELWASTALKSLSDGFGRACSPEALPFALALALHANQMINQHLVSSVREPLDLGARAMLQHAVWMNTYSRGPSVLGMVAALRHQIGAVYDVPHGVASTIVFPHCIQFNRPLIDEPLVLIAKFWGLPFKNAAGAAEAILKRLGELIQEIGLPTRLRDVGVPRGGLQVIADAAMEDPAAQANLKRVNSKEQLIGVLEQAW